MKISFDVNTPWQALGIAKVFTLPGRERDARLEKVIQKHAFAIVSYVKQVLHARWPEAEEKLLTNTSAAYEYARDLGFRWPELEAKLEDPLRKRWISLWRVPSANQQREWAKDPRLDVGITLEIFLNDTPGKLTPEALDFMLLHRPDLAGEIADILPEALKAKYKHEIELSKVDL